MKRVIFILAAGLALLSHAETDGHPVEFASMRMAGQTAQKPLRAGAPNDAVLAVNGLILRNPYSELYNANLPFPQTFFSQPTLLSGMRNVGNQSLGTTAFEVSELAPLFQTSLGAGSYGTVSGQALVRIMATEQLGLGGFAEARHADKVDDAGNGQDDFTAGAQAQYISGSDQLDLLVGHTQKEFGARGYYGTPASVFAEERTRDSLALFSWTRGDTSDAYLRATASLRQFGSEYTLGSSFSSAVDARQGGFVLEGKTIEIQHLALKLRGNLQNEQVAAGFGDDDRTYGSVLVLPQATFERVRLTAGLNSAFYTDRSPDYLPQAGIEYFASANSTLFAAYTESTQLPAYRDLHYIDPYHISNPALGRQKIRKSEIGFRQYCSPTLDWRVALFYRRTDGASDWVKDSAADVQWRVADLDALDVAGVESTVNWYPSEGTRLRVHYQGATKDDYGFYAGLYELDYPEHLLNLDGQWKIYPEIQLFASQTLRYQAANRARSGTDFSAEASAGLHYLPHFARNLRLSLQVDNLWGSHFEPVPGQKASTRTVSTAITLAW